ncbi:MAG: hypothetical protein SF066_03230 [Thermoanaerobaculia bacterium]|nr:hypothetical protein [Thermoanaerobaculia bacterium]
MSKIASFCFGTSFSLAVGWLLVPAAAAQAAAAAGSQSLKTVKIDLLKGTLDANLPFDEPFLLTGQGPKDALEVQIRYLSHPRDIRVAEKSDLQLCADIDPTSRQCRSRRRACEANPGSRPDGVECFSCVEKRKRRERGLTSATPWTLDGPERLLGGQSVFVANPIECPTWEPDGKPLTWRFPAELDWDAASNPPDTNRTFAVTIPALEAERYYSFHISLRSSSQDAVLAEQTAALQARGAQLLLDELGQMDASSGPEDYEACLRGAAEAPASCQDLPGQICRLLLQLEEAQGAQFEPGSLCAEDGTARPSLQLGKPIVRLAAAHQQRSDALELRRKAVDDFLDLLAELHAQLAPTPSGSPSSLDKLLSTLDAAADAPNTSLDAARVRRLLDELAPGREILAAGTVGQKSVALGATVEARQAFEDPNLATDPAVAQRVAAGYRQTATALAALEDGLGELLTGIQRLLVNRLIAGAANTALPAADRLSAADLTGGDTSVEGAAQLIGRGRELALVLAAHTSELGTALTEEQAAAQELAKQIVLAGSAASFTIDGRAFAAFATQQVNYISADLGVVWAPDLGEVVPAIGANLYLRPVNKDVPLRLKGGFMRRFAFTFGVTAVEEIGDGDTSATPPVRATREDLINGHSLLLGAGYRVTDSARVTLGAIVFYELDPNPLKTGRDVTFSPFLALSFDWDVAGLFGGVFKDLALTP